MNDPTALPPANGSPPDDLPHPDLMNGAGPSLAPSAHHEPAAETLPAGRLPSFQPHSAPTGLPAAPPDQSPLEERLRRLEDALAQVADPKLIESRIADRVAERLAAQRPVPVAQIAPAVPANNQGPSMTIPTGMILDVGRRTSSSTAAMTAPHAAAAEPQHDGIADARRAGRCCFSIC